MDAIGRLVGVLAVQSGRAAEADALAQIAIARFGPAPPWVDHRIALLHNHAVALRGLGRLHDAVAMSMKAVALVSEHRLDDLGLLEGAVLADHGNLLAEVNR